MSQSGIRFVAGELSWKDVHPVKRDETITSAQLIVYAEDDEHFSFIPS